MRTLKDKVEVYEEAVVMVQALGVDLVAALVADGVEIEPIGQPTQPIPITPPQSSTKVTVN